MKLVPVKFTKPWDIYHPGMIAGFSQKVADECVALGVAEFYEPAPDPVREPIESVTADLTTPVRKDLDQPRRNKRRRK